ncbi:MAG TPA: Os1348 family NHLP clan protein [Chloroflexota bacterium]|nr:Os1348 family NHLP clan protein [Chloroflexota bacterium]
MSLQEVERVMQRALREEAFRELLRTNPGAALASYELTADERAALLGLAPREREASGEQAT